MLRHALRAVFSRAFLWRLASPQFWAWFAFLKIVMWLFEHHPVLQRADLGGFDVAMAATERRSALRTAVVAVTASDVEQFFANTRPVPPESLLRVVREIVRLEPAVLVVDVFTDDPRYAQATESGLQGVVWAQSADTLRWQLVPPLGGRAPPPRAGFAAMLAEDDGLVRRVRLRFQGDSLARPAETLPLAAVSACPTRVASWCRLSRNIPADTNSVALRNYDRDPPLYALEDVMAAASAPSPDSPLKDLVVVLGFADGSDLVATPYGVRPGPQVVADAIEGLMDPRGGIRRMPALTSHGLDLAGALLINAVQFSLHSRPQLAALWTLIVIIVTYFASRLLLVWPGYWTSVVPVMVGMWVEQLFEEIKGKPHPGGPPSWVVSMTGWWRRRSAARADAEPPSGQPQTGEARGHDSGRGSEASDGS